MSIKTDPRRAEALVRLAASHADAGAEDILDRAILTRAQISRMAELAQDAFDELFAGAPNEKRMSRKLREALSIVLDLEGERHVDDVLLARAVKLVREHVVRRSERERLAAELAAMAIARFREMPEDELEMLAGEDEGLLAQLRERLGTRSGAAGEDLAPLVIDIGRLLALPFLRAFPADSLDTLIHGAARVCDLAEKGQNAADAIRETATVALEAAGVIKVMRRAFAGLLVGDMILAQVGKNLGIREKVSVTDFVIFLGSLIADKQLMPKVDKDDLRRVRADLEKI
jgi:hypothetical protein